MRLTKEEAKEINLPGLAECFEVFNGMPEDSVMEESLGRANPKIPQDEMVGILPSWSRKRTQLLQNEIK